MAKGANTCVQNHAPMKLPVSFAKNTLVMLVLAGSCAAWADVSIYSAMRSPTRLLYKDRDGKVKEVRLSPLQHTKLSCADKQKLEIVVQDDKGAEVGKGTVSDRTHWILGPGKDGQVLLVPAGEDQAGRPLSDTVQVFNATGYTMSALLHPVSADRATKVEQQISLPRDQACASLPIPEGAYTLVLQDEGGNPMGGTYSYVKQGHFYVVYRKRANTYDVESLGSILSTP